MLAATPVLAAQNGSGSRAVTTLASNAPDRGAAGEARATRDKLLAIRVRLLRLALRLGQSHRNSVVAQVLYRLELAERLNNPSAGSMVSSESAFAMAEEAEASSEPPLDFTCTILLLGKTGVGKSATINSLLGEGSTSTSAFDSETKTV